LVGLVFTDLNHADAQTTKVEPPASTSPDPRQQVPEDPLGRSTPYGTVSGLRGSAENGDLERASEYLASGRRAAERRALARQLWLVLDRKLRTGLSTVSRRPDGDLDDGLTNRDRIGVVESPSGNVEIFLDRLPPQADGARIWVFSSSTLQEVPRLADEVEPLWIETYVPGPLRTARWLSIPLYRWIGFFLVIPLVFGFAAVAARVLTASLRPLFGGLTRGQEYARLATVGPLRLLVLAVCFYFGSLFGFSLAIRQFWNRVTDTLMVIALCWLALRLLDVVTSVSLNRLERAHRSGDTALIRLINRLLKATTVILSALFLLYLANVDLTAALTGLGVGGLAIGVGAQKTIENLFGGIMVISDKPVSVGDVCKVGEFVGTVEDIGLRSTRIRTLDRTVVSVPNGQLALMTLENYAQRDRFRFYHTIGLARTTTTDQLREVLARIPPLLDGPPKIEPLSARARFIRVSNIALDIELHAYVLERDHPTFMAIQEELLLSIIDAIEACGVAFASPPPTLPPTFPQTL